MPTDLTQFAIPAAAFIVGLLLSFLLLKSKNAQIRSSLEKEISELKDSLKNSDEELAHETNSLMASHEKIEELENKKKDLEARLADSEKESERVPQLETERDESRRKENELQEKINELTDQLTELSQKQYESQTLADELDEQKAKVEELGKTVQDFETKITASDEKLREHQKLADDFEEQSKKITELETTITEYSEKIAESGLTIEEQQTLMDELAGHKVKVSELETSIASYEEKLAEKDQLLTQITAQEPTTTEPDQGTAELQKIINDFSATIAREFIQGEHV